MAAWRLRDRGRRRDQTNSKSFVGRQVDSMLAVLLRQHGQERQIVGAFEGLSFRNASKKLQFCILDSVDVFLI